MKIFKRLLPSSHIHLYAIGLGLAWLAYRHWWAWIPLLLYAYWMRKQRISKSIWVMMVLFYGWTWYVFEQPIPTPSPQGIIVQQEDVKTGYRYTVQYGLYRYHLYTPEVLNIGSIISVEGDFKTFETDRFEGAFSPKDYYRSKWVTHVIYQPKIIQQHQIWIPHQIHQDLKQHIGQLPTYTQVFVSSLVLGIFESDMKARISKIGITHLFVLSGLHVTVLMGILNRCLWFLPKKIRLGLETVLLFTYLWVTLFPISLIRAVIQTLLFEWLNHDKIRYTRLDAFSFTWVLMLIINPYYLSNTSFQLTFLVSFLFIISNFKTDALGMMVSTFSAQTLVLPITSKITNQVYPLAFLVAPWFIPVFSYVLLPLSWLALWDKLGMILNPVFELVLNTIGFLEAGVFYFTIPVLSGIFALFYWILWGMASIGPFTIKKAYRMTYVVLFLVLIPQLKYLNPIGKVTFLSVGQGDTTIIERPFSQCTVVIDAFGDVMDYLYLQHIQTIDYLIITHGDFDHHRETEPILNSFQVKQLVLSKYDEGDFEASMRKFHPLYVKQGDKLPCGDIELNILSPIHKSNDDNENSIVIQTKIRDTTYLFMGDLGVSGETTLVNQNQELISDILKVGHHGSITSSHISFLTRVNPKIAIISAGVDNHFGHPHPAVVDRLKQRGIDVYQTNVVQTITFIDLPFYKRHIILVHKKG